MTPRDCKRREIALNAALMLCAWRANAQTFTLSRSEAIRQPQRVSLSADASRITYVIGDTLWVANARDGSARRAVASGMSQSSGKERPFHALSVHGNRVIFTQGEWAVERARVADIGAAIRVRPLLADSIASRLMLFQHYAAGGPSWSPDERHLVFLAADRTRDEALQIFIEDVVTGALRRITNDGRMHYSVVYSPDGKLIASSQAGEKPGSCVIELLNSEGKPVRRIATIQSDYATDLMWSPDGRRLAVYTAQNNTIIYDIALHAPAEPIEIHGRRFVGWTSDGTGLLGARRNGMSSRLVTYALQTEKLTDLTSEDTLFTAIATASDGRNTLLAFTRESGDMPRDIWMLGITKAGIPKSNRITNANAGVKASLPGASRIFRWHVADGRMMEAQLFLPHTTGRHPLVVMPYGGYRNSFPASEYFLDFGILPLLSKGYAVVRPNTRGQVSEDRPIGQYGSIQLTDTEAMIDSMSAQGLIDAKRVAILGHSHGGSMAYYYETHSSRWCAVVAINGRADWELQAKNGDGFLVRTRDRVPSCSDRNAGHADSAAERSLDGGCAKGTWKVCRAARVSRRRTLDRGTTEPRETVEPHLLVHGGELSLNFCYGRALA